MKIDTIAPIIVLVVIVLPMAAILSLFALGVRNDLSRRWQRLLALASDVRVCRQRRQGVGKDVGRHLYGAQRHEHQVTRAAARRGAGGGRMIRISDTHNGWPASQAMGLTTDAIRADLGAREAELVARQALHAEAQAYNGLVARWPHCVVATMCGFRFWTFKQRNQGGRRQKR